MFLDSPFASYLGTNYCPEDEEVLKLNAFLVEPSLQLKRLDDEMADLRRALDKLEEAHRTLLAHVDAHRALLSPVRRLPLDVLQEIFIACMPSDRNCVMSALEAPVLLGRICRSWRDISLSTPRLWSRLHIAEPQRDQTLYFLGAGSDPKFAQRFENIKMWLGRSGQCPLSISLYSDPNNRSPPDRSAFVQALLPFTPRWQHIHFITSPVTLDAISHLTESDVPLLETVIFDDDYYDLSSPTVGLEQFGLLRSPRISTFSARENAFVGQNLPLPWHGLTVLEIIPSAERSLTSEKIIHIISRCPELRVCKLAVNDDGTAEPSSSHLVELKHLHTLEVVCQSVDLTIPRLLDRLLLPQLLSFSLHGSSHGEHTPSLAHALARWNQLENLEIDSDGFSKPSLVEGLRSLPDTMKQLVIHDVTNTLHGIHSLDDDALTILTPTPGHYHCPALELLEINNGYLISDSALLRLITSRMESRSKLKGVQITFSREMTFDILPFLQPFIENGLNISMLHAQPFTVHLSPWAGLSDVSNLHAWS
ncbi:hypothetical protein C8F04DRAFT_181747 [Mycena alexandri]|uniref:F-box domain-containing protein n=1 Tax=Mycena alexandri TaxID=1745969 RepID=A0AAD6S9L8_9AGAR|nr:hypothetical protein C8F04DRAFT_181747 [Mycena alexandri]